MDFLELGERDALGDEVALGVRDAVAVEPGERLPAGAALRVLVDVNRHRLHQSTRRPRSLRCGARPGPWGCGARPWPWGAGPGGPGAARAREIAATTPSAAWASA